MFFVRLKKKEKLEAQFYIKKYSFYIISTSSWLYLTHLSFRLSVLGCFYSVTV